MSKSKGKLLFVAKEDTSQMTLKDRIIQAAKNQGKKSNNSGNNVDQFLHDPADIDGSPIESKQQQKMTDDDEWDQFVQESEKRKLSRVASGTMLKDVSEYEDEIAYVRRMVLSSRFATTGLIPDSVKVAFKNMKMEREIEAISKTVEGEQAKKSVTLKSVVDNLEQSLMEEHVRDQFLQEQMEFLEEKKAAWLEKKAKEKSKIYAAAEKGFTADGLISVAKMLEIQQEIAAQRAQFEMREGRSEEQWVIHQFKMDAINGFKTALQDTPEGDLARADLENTMGPSHITLIRNLEKHRKLVASSKPQKYLKKPAHPVQLDEYTGKHENAMHGSSVLKSLSMHFDGSFHTNSFTGPGMLLHNNGMSVIGIFAGDCINDFGVLVHSNEGWWYKGELKGSRRHGFGVWGWKNHGIMYEGLWDQDRMHGFGRMTSLSNGSYLTGRWNFGILDEYGRLLDDLGNLHSIKCPPRRSGKNVFKPELASFIQGGKICDDDPDDHNKCVRSAESAKSMIVLSMHKIKKAEEHALAALDNVKNQEQIRKLLAFAGVNHTLTDSAIADKFAMSDKIYNVKLGVTHIQIPDEIIEEPVTASAKEFSCSSHFCIGNHMDCVCVVKAAEVRRLITLFSSVFGEEVSSLIDNALSDAKPLLKFDILSREYDMYGDNHAPSDSEHDDTFEQSYFLCGPAFHRACHSLRIFYGRKMWKWYKSMRWFRVMKNAKSLNRSMSSIYGDGEFTERSQSSFFSRWMIPDDSRPQTARSFMDVSKNNAEIGRIRNSLASYIDPVYYEDPPELDELKDIATRANAAYEGYTIEIFEDEMQLICRVPSKRAVLHNTTQLGSDHENALKNTPKSVLSSNSSAPSSRPSSRPSVKRIPKSKSTRHHREFQCGVQENTDAALNAALVIHSRPGSAVRFIQPASDALLSMLVADASVADSRSITNFAYKQESILSDSDDEEAGIHDDDREEDTDDRELLDTTLADLVESDQEIQMTNEKSVSHTSDTSRAVKMSLRDGFTHYGLHLQWDLREIPSFETHRNCDIFETSDSVSVVDSECSSLPSSYARLLFS